MIARAAALDLRESGLQSVFLLQVEDLPVESTPEQPPNSECIDFLFFTHGRHEGNREAALQYLSWEMNLIRQLDEAERNTFQVSA